MTGHVYIVDDDAGFRSSLGKIVSSVGFTYDEWDTPVALMEVRDFRRPGCIVLDYRLPDMSGLDVLKTIRRTSSIPVVLISAFADVRITVGAMQAGTEGVFEKPLDDNEFLGFLERVCFRDRERAQKQTVCRSIQSNIRALTAPEREVLFFMLKGQPNKVIANNLGKSVKAVERNRQRLISKLGCQTSSEVILKVTRCPMMSVSPLNCDSNVCALARRGIG